MPRKSSKKAKTTPNLKQKQSQKQVVNVTINNDKKKTTTKKKALTSSQKINNVAKSLRGTPSKDMIYRTANFQRPVNYNIVPDLPMTGNQLITEMRQIMNAHEKPVEKTPLQMTEEVKRSLMNKANGIVQEIKQNQSQIDASNKIKAHIKQKINSDALEQIIEENIDSHLANRTNNNTSQSSPARSTRIPGRRPTVRIPTPTGNVTMSMYNQVMGPGGEEPPLTQRGFLRKGTKLYKEYINKSRNN